jgi:hypothetical protein
VSASGEELEIGEIYVLPDLRAARVKTGPDTAVPSRFDAQIHLLEPSLTVAMKIVVDLGGRALVREFAVSPTDRGSTVTTRLLRKIPIERLMRAALKKVTVPATSRPDIHPNAFQVPGDSDDQAWVSPEPKPGRGREVSADRVARAAEIYRQALAAGSRAPGEAVAAQLNYSRATAARDIKAARERGLLPAAGTPEATQGRLSPPSNDAVDPNPIWRRFDDPTRWASMQDVIDGPSGVPVFDPSKTGTSAPSPTPVPRDPSKPDLWLQRIQDAATFNRENPDFYKPRPENESSAGGDADAADE